MRKFLDKIPILGTVGVVISLISALFGMFLYLSSERANNITESMVKEASKANKLTESMVQETANANKLTESMVKEYAKTNKLSEETMNTIKEQKEIARSIFQKENSDKAVWDSDVMQSLKNSFEINTIVNIKLSNMSKFNADIYVRVLSENICIYKKIVTRDCQNDLVLDRYLISPNNSYINSFTINAQEGYPEKVKITVMVYDRIENALINTMVLHYRRQGNNYNFFE